MVDLKVALVGDEFSRMGTGISRYNYELLRGLRKRGVKVTPVTLGRFIKGWGSIVGRLLKVPWELLKAFKDHDLIHATTPVNALSFPLIKAVKIVTYHDLTPLCLLYTSPSPRDRG
mgnify:CR=1 FL=1